MTGRSPRVVLLTGASSGIGAEVAREAARLGFHLVLNARRVDRLEALAEELTGGGSEALAVPADLADSETPDRLVSAAVGRFGGLDVLINNAGFGLPHLSSQADPDDVRRQLDVNLVAPIVLTLRALPHLLERRGTIINVGSAITGIANPALGAYGASKAGLAYWNDALRRELRHRGVSVCLVEPGPVETEFFEAMGQLPDPPAGLYNPMRDPPPPILNIGAGEVARRIVRLIDHPRRRLSVPRRVVWPHRVVGAIFQAAPWLGDFALSYMVRHLERTPGGPLAQGRTDDVRTAR